ncbi:hypothetical protein [Planomonospora parontospora]|uniref:hypothetical protein n=1 Tax=Planomonospora parontospora TaxID=58119 RepID=UPI0016708393|nr:hypothetical protein [Planomonospora parontospora]GGL53595.1 hypothetical protein GCM10014719_63610 [Planomonospora parontospora subsp. antibiotica]GII19598.1 hypothetical protein Ppa05_63240 [Planomonospora parontospora subsp. antibiotica]
MHKPITNHQLHALMAEAGYDRSHAALARQVSRAGATRYGLVLRYDGASVYWWLRGRCPEQPVPELIAAVLGHRLGCPVPIAELGFARLAQAPDAETLVFPGSLDAAVTASAALWAKLSRPSTDAAQPFVPAAAVDAGWRWHFDPPDHDLARSGSRRVDTDDVERLRTCQDQFLDLDRRHGGGHARTFLAEFLARDVAPMLRGSYTDSVGRELFAVAAELTGTLAFMAYDAADHAAAQRAFTQALRLAKAAGRLAKAAGDRTYGAHVLANLATQAIFLNLPAEAVRLSRAAVEGAGRRRRRGPPSKARAAVEGAGRRPAPAVAARLHTTDATACALAGDLPAFRAALRRADRALDRDDGTGPSWARYFTPAHLAGTAMRCLLDLDRPAEALTHAGQALQLAPGNARTRALHTALTATAHARAGHIDQAAALGMRAAGLARHLRSRRVQARLATLARALAKHQAVPEARDFLEVTKADQ